jgi:phage terminase Nu1 subunit (DNA packaging protein)
MPASTITTTQLAKLIDITPRHVRRLTRDGILSRAVDDDGSELEGRYSLLAVRDYCRYLRGLMRLEDTSESRRANALGRKAEADAELTELKLKEYKDELHNARHIEFIWTSILTRFKARLLALPSRVARRCVGKKFREILTIITQEIEQVLRELSKYDATAFKKQRDAYLESQQEEVASLNGEGKGDTDSTDGSGE